MWSAPQSFHADERGSWNLSQLFIHFSKINIYLSSADMSYM